MNPLHSKIVRKVAEDLGISSDVVSSVYNAYMLYIKDTLSSIELKDDMTEEEFRKLRTTINIPGLGKIGIPYQKYCKVQKQGKIIQNFKNSKNED